MAEIVLAIAILTNPCRPPQGAEVARKTVPLTAYYLPSENDGWSGKQMPGLPGTSVQREFWKAVQMNGTGILSDGRFVVIQGTGFRQVTQPRGRWGDLSPYKTAAAHSGLFEAGTTVCFPDLRGLTVEVTDTGGGLGPEGPLDIFVGDKRAYNAWLKAGPSEALTLSWKEEKE